MYELKYHSQDLSRFSFLITGGAGFIGSNLVEYLLKYNAGHVRVLDNLSNGYFANIKEFTSLANFEFVEGDIRDLETCKRALVNIDYVSHQAALGSVPRSIENPINTNSVNIDGFLNMLVAVKESPNVKRMIYAASSSTYGDSPVLPKVEGNEGNPLSPYAVTKLVNELYADVFSKVYGLHTVGLRYFNIFGPKQNPTNPYAAVIAKACYAYLTDTKFTVNGDGLTSRDFTFVENAVQANMKALFAEEINKHEVVNIACDDQTNLLELLDNLKAISGKEIEILFSPERSGDIKHSRASIEKAQELIGYKPQFKFTEGIRLAYDYYSGIKSER